MLSADVGCWVLCTLSVCTHRGLRALGVELVPFLLSFWRSRRQRRRAVLAGLIAGAVPLNKRFGEIFFVPLQEQPSSPKPILNIKPLERSLSHQQRSRSSPARCVLLRSTTCPVMS